jgi:Flp pilus assembly protein TadG
MNTRMQTRRSLSLAARTLKCTKGSAAIEFALLFPLLLLIVFGITEFGRAIRTVQTLNSAAREGARVAAVTNPDVDLVTTRVNEVLDAANVVGSGVNVEGPLGTGTNRTVRVTVTSEFEVLSGTILEDFTGTLNLQGMSVMRFEG